MNPLLITITFLSLMGILTASTVKQFVSDSFEKTLYSSFTKTSAQAEEIRTKAALNEVKLLAKNDLEREVTSEKKKKKKKIGTIRSTDLEFDKTRPPDNSRLNFYLLLFEDEKIEPISRYEIAARLMRNLYGKHPFFQKIPRVEYRILDKLIEKRDDTKDFEFPDELGTIPLGDSEAQEIFYNMLKGGHSGELPYPSLLHFITFENKYFSKKKKEMVVLRNHRKKINLYFAPAELLEAIFDNPKCAKKIDIERAQLWDQILTYEQMRKENRQNPPEKITRKELADKLKLTFKDILSEYSVDEKYSSLFDFTLGECGHILLIKDPRTELTMRQKIPRTDSAK